MTAILGLNAYHPDAVACLLVDGRVVAAVAEERLGRRIKHYAAFPSCAIRSVLEMAGLRLKDVDYVALGHDNNANLSAKLSFVARHPARSAGAVLSHFSRRGAMTRLAEGIARACDEGADQCRFKTAFVEHHLAHLASSFFASPFERAAGFSYDGSGDFVSAMYARCEGNKIEILKRVYMPHSLGFFYTAVCQFIGFDRFGDEYKVMGLSAYGQPAYAELMRAMLRGPGQGAYRLESEYFRPLGAGFPADYAADSGEIALPPMHSDSLVRQLGPPRIPGSQITVRDKDLACSCQKHFERVVIDCANWLHRQVRLDALVAAGGCALNGVCNARILRDTPFERSYIHCAASDDGTAVGAALYVWHAVLGRERSEPIEQAYWGPEYSRSRMAAALDSRGLAHTELDGQPLLEHVAGHLARGRVVGWYQARSEWGPRALGNRSILAHPGLPGMKDLINRKIKRREPFRPFAPSVLAEAVEEYFEQPLDSPFMMHVVRIKPHKTAPLAAVCHEDSTARLHTVRRSQNPLYYDLIGAFAARTHLPVLLNTSFNENEPIVDTPEQAVDCFVRSDLDVLVLGPYVTVKPGRELDASVQVGKSDR